MIGDMTSRLSRILLAAVAAASLAPLSGVQTPAAGATCSTTELWGAAHVQSVGDVPGRTVCNQGVLRLGTVGRALRLEEVQLRVRTAHWGWSPSYISGNAHVQNIGWQGYTSTNRIKVFGTTGRGLRMEAFRARLSEADVVHPFPFKLCYRAHVQNIGWQSWKCEGDIAGTVGRSLRIEALDLQVRPR